MKRYVRKYFITVVLMFSIVFCYAFTSNADTKWAIACGFVYPSQSHGSYLDTMPTTQAADADFDSSGYSCTCCQNVDAGSVYNDLPGNSNQILYFCGHGIDEGSGLVFCNGSTSSHADTYIKAGSGTNGENGIYYMSLLDTGCLSNMIVAIYVGCRTGMTSTSSYANLLDKTTVKGASCAIGWTCNIEYGYASVWSKEFTKSLKDGWSVNYSMYLADQKIKNEFGESDILNGYILNHTYSGSTYVWII